MKLKTTLNGKSFAFRDIKDVLAKENEPKAGDRLQGIAAETATERVAAKVVLSELTVGDLTENPTIPYEKDEVTRVNTEELGRCSRAFTGEVVAAVAKLMSAMDLVYGASKISRLTQCVTQIGLPGTLSYRLQANSVTDDVSDILIGVMEGLSYGSGDACLGINPVTDDVENTKRISSALWELKVKYDIPT